MASKILIIEDEPDILIYLSAVFEDNGFEVCSVDANDPIADEVKAAQPDLIILDVMLPKRSGVSIYAELRASALLKNTPVIILSGFIAESGNLADDFGRMISKLEIAPPDGYLGKPVDLAALISLVTQLTASKEE